MRSSEPRRRDLRVLHIIDNLTPGGTESQCVELVRGLSARGVENALFYSRPGALLPRLDEPRITVCPVPAVSLKSVQAPMRVLKLALMIRRWAPDVVQTYGFYSNVPGLLAAFLARVPVRVGGRRELGQYLTRAQRRADRWAWRLADRVTVNSESVRQHILCEPGFDPRKVVVIRNGVNLEVWPPPDTSPSADREPVVGMVAHFREQKDHATFLQGAREVLRVVPSVRFCLVGSGPLESTVRNVARCYGIADRVDFRIGLEGQPLREVVRGFRVSVLTSKDNEGLPNAVLESMAAGVPVVATAVGGTPEIIDDSVTGFLIPSGNPAALAGRIVLLLKEPSLARTVGERGRQRIASEFSLDRMVDRFANLYRELVATKRNRGARCAE